MGIQASSKGKETEYLWVEYHQSGSVHGYPITEDELRSYGVKI